MEKISEMLASNANNNPVKKKQTPNIIVRVLGVSEDTDMSGIVM